MIHNNTSNDRHPAAFGVSPADHNYCNISYNIPIKIIGFYLPDKRLCCEFTANCVLFVGCCQLSENRSQITEDRSQKTEDDDGSKLEIREAWRL
jgi:hypothetical protein